MSCLDFQCRHRFAGGFELDAAFRADRGVTSLFGPSGSGKTTILSMIAGVLRPQTGRITVGENHHLLLDTSRGRCLTPEQRRVGYVPQDHLLFPHLTVAANLNYGAGRPRSGPAIELQRLAKVLEIGDLLGHYPRSLSGGQSQRVALGRALLSGPDLLLLDEPLTALDQQLKSRVLEYLERVLHEWNIPTLIVSHSIADVRRIASRAVLIESGRVIGQGTTDEMLMDRRVLQWRDAAAPKNVLRLERVEAANGVLRGWAGDQSLSFVGQAEVPFSCGITVPAHVYVQFLPRDVMLSVHEVTGVSARNHLRGVVRQIVHISGAVYVVVDLGQLIWAEVTAAAVSELGLQPGTEVTCLLKASSVHVAE